jgi:xanthine/uracil permease
LIPAALVLLILSFSPAAIGWIGAVPSLVVGTVLIYIMSSQIAAGLIVAFSAEEPFVFEGGLVIGVSVLLGALTAFLPAPLVDTFPTVLKPILGNGFVVGVVASLALEHLVFRR